MVDMITVPFFGWSYTCSNNCDLLQLIIYVLFGLFVVLAISVIVGIFRMVRRSMRKHR